MASANEMVASPGPTKAPLATPRGDAPVRVIRDVVQPARGEACTALLSNLLFSLNDGLGPHGTSAGVPHALVMKEADPGKAHHHPILVARRDHVLVLHRAPRLGDVAHAAARRAIDRVPEGKVRIGAERDATYRL